MPLRPLNDSIILKPNQNQYTSDLSEDVRKALEGGKLVLPEKYEGALKKVVGEGVIVTWGNGCKYKYREGQTIFYGQFAGAKMKFGDEKLLVIRETEALALQDD